MTPLIEAINDGDGIKTAQRLLMNQPDLLDKADLQGNTPLHYAATQRNQGLIHFLIERGAKFSIKNHEGETAASWWRTYVKTKYQWEDGGDLELLPEEIEKGNEYFVSACLKGVGSTLLRYPKGETLLHIATHHRQLPIVKLLLDSVDKKILNKLLHSKNGRGETPLAIAQAASLQGKVGSQAILSYLQEKEQAAAEPLNMPAQTVLSGVLIITRGDIQRLSELLSRPVTQADFASLHPLLPTLCIIAYAACEQALLRLSSIQFKKPTPRLFRRSSLGKTQALLKQLFGKPCDEELFNQLLHKIAAVADYLKNLVQQKQVFQLIQLSDENPNFEGWTTFPARAEAIFLNPTRNTNLIGLVKTLIHEMTHIVNGSFDFVYNPALVQSRGGYTFDFSNAGQLASKGKIMALTPKERNLFETWKVLLIGHGNDSGLNSKRHCWLAANNADTQAAAILALAAQQGRYADFDRTKRELWIDRKFLTLKHLEKIALPEDNMGNFKICIFFRRLSGRLKKSLSDLSVGDDHKEQLLSASTENEGGWSDISLTKLDCTDSSPLPVDETQQLRQQMAASSISTDGAPAAVGSSAQPGPSLAGTLPYPL